MVAGDIKYTQRQTIVFKSRLQTKTESIQWLTAEKSCTNREWTQLLHTCPFRHRWTLHRSISQQPPCRRCWDTPGCRSFQSWWCCICRKQRSAGHLCTSSPWSWEFQCMYTPALMVCPSLPTHPSASWRRRLALSDTNEKNWAMRQQGTRLINISFVW